MNDNYNGWYDWETWNCALWIANDERYYEMAQCGNYANFLSRIDSETTPDGARWEDADHSEMDEMIAEISLTGGDQYIADQGFQSFAE